MNFICQYRYQSHFETGAIAQIPYRIYNLTQEIMSLILYSFVHYYSFSV